MWQRCPICNGEGSITKLIPYDGRSIVVPSPISGVCPVCKGQRIISELNGLPPRPNFGQELINNDDFNSKIQEEMLDYFRKRDEDIKKRQKQNEILTNKELTDNLFNIAKEQKSDDLDKYNYIKERLDTTGRASIRQDEFDFVQEFEKKLY